jgi:putative membrane protein
VPVTGVALVGRGDLWVLDPLALAVAGAAAVVAGHRRAATGRGSIAHRRLRDRWLLAGAAVAVLSLVSPVAGLAGGLASAHMVQHLLLLVVAAPLIALGDPGPALLAALPAPARRRAVAGWRRCPRGLRRPGAGVAVGAAGSAVSLWLWHVPALYAGAVTSSVVHLAEHASFLVPAVVFWGAVVRRRTRHRQVFLVTVLASAALVMQGGVLAALLVFTPHPMYPVYDATSTWGLTALEDQRLAGTFLWAVGGPVHALVAVVAVVRGLAASEDLAPSRSGRA